MNDVSASFCSIVLAGGKSRRLGRNKQCENVGGLSMFRRVVDTLSPLSRRIFLVTSAASDPHLPTGTSPGVSRVADIYPDCGTIGGICTGLKHSSTFRSFAAACDMPFLNPDLVKHLMQASAGFDLVIPRVGEFVEPLHAVYSRDCIGIMEEQMRAGNYRVAGIAGFVKTRYVDREEIERFDPQHLSFFNVNTQHDLQIANSIAEARLEERGAGSIVCGLV